MPRYSEASSAPPCPVALLLALALSASPAPADPVLPPGGGWDNPPGGPLPAGVVHRTFRSDSMGVDVGYNVYLPPGYGDAANAGRRYPVVYWLHGLTGNESNGMYPPELIDRVVRDGTVPPVIVVFANGGARTRYHDSADGKVMAETLIAKELIGHVDRTYRTVASRDGRSIQGHSMGGNGALKFAFKYPELFSSAVAFAPALVDGQWMAQNDREFLDTMFGGDAGRYQRETAAEVIKRNADNVRGKVAVLILAGTEESEGLLSRDRAMHRLLDELKVPHEYEELPGLPHDLSAYFKEHPARGLARAAKQVAATGADAPRAAHEPPFRTLDLDRGEAREVELPGARKVKVKLLDVREERDSLRSAVRRASIRLEIDGTAATVSSGNYHLPVTVGGVQVDCPVTKGYYPNHDPFEDSWGLAKDARVRIWPKDAPWLEPETFVYPVKQRWFAGPTQIGNEPSYVDGGDNPHANRPIYYHAGNDIGGCEGMVDVVSACDGVVASAGGKPMPEYADAPFYKPRGDYDYVYVVDARGWFYRYAHLQSIDPAVRPGARVKAGQQIGVLGKEGSSGGWAHLHFDIKAKQPSGQWGVQDAYPFLWEAYQREHKPKIAAVARPHHLAAVGETVRLDGSRSWSAAGTITRYEWTFCEGGSAEGATVERTYDRPGSYSEILKVTDATGQVDYDFAVVQVVDKDPAKKLPPTIHAAYAPTFDVRPGEPVTFKVRTFRTGAAGGEETWDFGDGSDRVTVRSGGSAREHDPDGYARTVYPFKQAGHYVVRVEGRGAGGMTAVGHLQVRVAERPPSAP